MTKTKTKTTIEPPNPANVEFARAVGEHLYGDLKAANRCGMPIDAIAAVGVDVVAFLLSLEHPRKEVAEMLRGYAAEVEAHGRLLS